MTLEFQNEQEKGVGKISCRENVGKCFAIYLQRSVIFYNCLAQDLDICLEKYIQASMIFSRFIADLDNFQPQYL